MVTPIRGLVLDFGEVLTQPQPPQIVAEMARRADVPVPQFVQAYWAHRRDYDLGLPASHYWTRVLQSCACPAFAHDGDRDARDALIAGLIDCDARSWMVYREAMWERAAVFRASGGRTAMLSNGVPEVMARVRADRPLDRWFDVVVISFELGVVKPSREIYEACLSRLGTSAHETLFVDDRLENIDAAARVGLQTVHFTGDVSVAEVSRRLAT